MRIFMRTQKYIFTINLYTTFSTDFYRIENIMNKRFLFKIAKVYFISISTFFYLFNFFHLYYVFFSRFSYTSTSINKNINISIIYKY